MSKKSPQIGPKKPQTAYIRFCNSMRSTDPEIAKLPVSEQGKILGEKWTNLSDDKKQEHVKLYEIDKKKYDEEMEEFKKTDEYKKMKQMKKTKTTKRTKMASAYQCFLKEEREAKKEKGEKFNVGDFSKASSEKWKNIGTEGKAKYEKMAREMNGTKDE